MGRRWCETDPLMRVNGENVKLKFYANTEDDRFATGPIEIFVYGATDVEVSESNVFGQKIEAQAEPDQGFGLEFEVGIPGPDGIEVRVLAYPAGAHNAPVLFGVGETNIPFWLD